MNKNHHILLELVVVVALVAYGLWSMVSVPATVDTAVQTQTENPNVVGTNANVPAKVLSYQEALMKYKDTRIQIDGTCQASPDRMVIKNNTNIMIDNRAPVARTIKVDSTFTIKPYDFKIINLLSSTLPSTWLVDCDSSQNVSTILIQR